MKAKEHKAAGEDFLTMKDHARIVRAIVLVDEQVSGVRKSEAVEQLELDRAKTAKAAPSAGWFGIPFRMAQRNIDRGRTTNKVDTSQSSTPE